jgi:hypothetical protein
MALLRRVILVVVAAAGGATGSQLPEYSQQYRQRLGGALDEMRQVVADFDADARRNNLSREEALATYGESVEPFLRDRGMSMTEVISRYEELLRQWTALEQARPLERPLVVLRSPDQRVATGAMRDYEPAVPLTAAGLVWAALGMALAGVIAWLLAGLAGALRPRRRAPAAGKGGRR